MQCEPPELVYVQRTMSIILDNGVEDDQAAEGLPHEVVGVVTK